MNNGSDILLILVLEKEKYEIKIFSSKSSSNSEIKILPCLEGIPNAAVIRKLSATTNLLILFIARDFEIDLLSVRLFNNY